MREAPRRLGKERHGEALVGLIGYPATLERPLEASVKYLVLSGVSSALLLFGIALVYMQLGALSFAPTTLAVPHAGEARGLYGLAGLALILVGIGFKLSLVPFHLWTPDVFEGASAPVACYVAVVSKIALFALLLRYFLATGALTSAPINIFLGSLAVLSMLAGNLLALLQNNLKRLLAYSSIAHVGYALVDFLAGGPLAVEAVRIYLVAYAISTLGAFAVVTLLSRPGVLQSAPAESPERDADLVADYEGLYSTQPWLAFALTSLLLSLAGIPLTVGFIAKLYAVTAGVGAQLAALLAALVIGSLLSLYYYLRIIAVMMRAPAAEARRQGLLSADWLGHAVVATLLSLLFSLGIYPAPLVSLVRATAVTLARNEGASALICEPFKASAGTQGPRITGSAWTAAFRRPHL